jgi:hypothetical protein
MAEDMRNFHKIDVVMAALVAAIYILASERDLKT